MRKRLEGHNDILTLFGTAATTTMYKKEMYKLHHAFSPAFPESTITISGTGLTEGKQIHLKIGGLTHGSVIVPAGGDVVPALAESLLNHNAIRDITILGGVSIRISWYHDILAVVGIDPITGDTTAVQTTHKQDTKDSVFEQGMPVILSDEGLLQVANENSTKPIIGYVVTEAPTIANDKITVAMHGHAVIAAVAGSRNASFTAGKKVVCTGWDFDRKLPVVDHITSAGGAYYGIGLGPAQPGDEILVVIGGV